MRLNNKGYTLVELLLSIAIFSIVMIGIASIMSGTLKSYSRANIDVAVQEDCQMAANQLEELLCDAKSIGFVDPDDHSAGWKFNDGTEQIIKYDGSKVTLTKGGNSYTIADHISSFSLDNWDEASNVTSSTEKAYNQIVINMAMNVNGTSYSVKRNVYFRNDVENPSFHGINNMMSNAGSTGGDSDDDTIKLTLKRYETYNLTADYQIDVPIKLYKKNGSNWEVVTDPNASPEVRNDAIFKLTKASNAPSGTYSAVYYLTTGANVDSNFGLTSDGEYKIEGTGVTIELKVEDVKFLTDGVVIQHHQSESVNGDGFTTPINVQGININEGLKSGNLVLKTNYKVMKGNNNKTNYLDNYLNVKKVTDGKAKADNIETSAPKGLDTVAFGMAPDPFNGGLSILGRNDKLKDNDGAKFMRTDSDLYFNFKFDCTSRGVSQSIPEAKIKFNALGVTF